MTILKQLPAGTRHYKSMPVFTEKTVPAALKKEHSTGAGIWAVIRVLEGALTFESLGDEPERVELGAGECVVVAPEQPHRIDPHADFKLQIDLWRMDDPTRTI